LTKKTKAQSDKKKVVVENGDSVDSDQKSEAMEVDGEDAGKAAKDGDKKAGTKENGPKHNGSGDGGSGKSDILMYRQYA